jgi:hypothetical protein
MKENISKMITNIYKERDSAYKILLKCDIAVDDILKELLKLIKK